VLGPQVDIIPGFGLEIRIAQADRVPIRPFCAEPRPKKALSGRIQADFSMLGAELSDGLITVFGGAYRQAEVGLEARGIRGPTGLAKTGPAPSL